MEFYRGEWGHGLGGGEPTWLKEKSFHFTPCGTLDPCWRPTHQCTTLRTANVRLENVTITTCGRQQKENVS